MTESTLGIDKEKNGFQYWHKIVILFCLGWTVIWINRAIIGPILPTIQKELGITSDAQTGLLASVFFFAYTFMQIPSGFLADKLGKKLVLIPGFVIFALGSIFGGLTTGFGLLLFSRFLTGFGQGTYYGPAYSMTAESVPKSKRSLSTAIINSGSALGFIIGTLAAGFFATDWRILLILSGILTALLTVVYWIVLKKNPPIPEENLETQKEQEKGSKASMASLFMNPKMLASYFLYFATCYGYYMSVTWLPKFLGAERNMELGIIATALSLFAVLSVPGALIFSRISDKFPTKKIPLIVTLELLACGSIFILGTSTNPTIIFVVLLFYGLIGKLAVEPSLISYVADNAPKQGYGTTFGVFNFFGMMSSIVAPFLTGLFSDKFGSMVPGFYLSAGFIILGIIVILIGNSIKIKEK